MNTKQVAAMEQPIERLVYWIRERDAIRKKKERGEPRPWTDDTILDTFRFCNIRREDDKVTRWIAENWRTPYQNHTFIAFGMVVARLFNLPSTLEAIGYPKKWNPPKVIRTLKKIREDGPIFNGAYIVSTNGRKMDKVDYVVNMVLNPLWQHRAELVLLRHATLQELHTRLMSFDGLGSFMAAQVVADVKYVPTLYKAVNDWHTFAASGPGSRRGLNRIMNQPVKFPWKEQVWHRTLTELRKTVNDQTGKNLHAQDLQNCLCEFDKYERVLHGEGKPKQKYS